MTKWISPAGAVAMLSNDPAGGDEDFGFSTLKLEGKNQRNSVLDLARAKLQPREPTAAEAAASSLPVTARDYRLVLAPLVPDTGDIEQLFANYDAKAPDRLTVLAAVLTMKFDRNALLHDMMSAVSTYAEMILARQRRLSSLVVMHMPSEGMSARAARLRPSTPTSATSGAPSTRAGTRSRSSGCVIFRLGPHDPAGHSQQERMEAEERSNPPDETRRGRLQAVRSSPGLLSIRPRHDEASQQARHQRPDPALAHRPPRPCR